MKVFLRVGKRAESEVLAPFADALEAESPDESALVDAARRVGWEFQDKKKNRMYLQTPKGPQDRGYREMHAEQLDLRLPKPPSASIVTHAVAITNR